MNHIHALHRSIGIAVQRFQRNPFDFLYERDLQALLFGILAAELGSEAISINGGCHTPQDYGSTDTTIWTMLVKCEYPWRERFDVAIIDSEAVRNYDPDELALKNDPFWIQPVRAAVEIKYLQLGDKPDIREAGVRLDIEKLKRYFEKRTGRPFLGISLLFMQPATPALSLFFLTGSEIREDPQEGVARSLQRTAKTGPRVPVARQWGSAARCGTVLLRDKSDEWDPRKAATNVSKHGVSFNEAPDGFCKPAGADLRGRGALYGRTPGSHHWAFRKAASVVGLLLGAGGHRANLQRPQGHEARATRL